MRDRKIYSVTSSKASRFPRKTVGFTLIFLGLLLGGWGGYEIREELYEKGCLALPYDVIASNVSLESPHSVKFIAMGDTGTGNTDQKLVADAVLHVCEARGCDFVLLLGDNIYPKGVDSLEDPQFKTAFEIPYAAINKPFFLVLGNHDIKGDVLSQVLYSLKSKRWRMPNFHYSFQAGPARFSAINTGCTFLPWYWSQKLIEPESSLWSFAFAHHPIYGSGTHGDTDIPTQWFWNQFIQNGIDFFLSGHNHHLEHLRSPGDLTEYIISGAGGKHYRSQKEREKTQPSDAISQFVYQDIGFVWLEVTPPQVQVKFFDGQAKELYQFTKKKNP